LFPAVSPTVAQYVVTHMKTQMASTKHQTHAKLTIKDGQTTCHTSLAQAQQADAEQANRHKHPKKHKYKHQPGARAALSRVETRKTNEGQKHHSPPHQIASEQNSNTDQILKINKKGKLMPSTPSSVRITMRPMRAHTVTPSTACVP
jgi:hypothetical protein